MFRPLELYIGLRYLRARRASRFVSFISLVSLLGVAVGVAALIVVLSVMNGFEQELRNRLLNLTSHAVVTAPGGRLEEWRPALERVKSTPGVTGAAPFVEVQAMLAHEGLLKGTLLRGIDPALEGAVSRVEAHLVAGSLEWLEPGTDRLVLGRLLAARLRVGLGDSLTLLVPSGGEGGARLVPRLRRFTVVGLFEVGMEEQDGVLALTHLADAAAARLGPQVVPEPVAELRLDGLGGGGNERGEGKEECAGKASHRMASCRWASCRGRLMGVLPAREIRQKAVRDRSAAASVPSSR